MAEHETAETILDARGWLCPLPVMQAKRLLALAAAGESLVVEATDPLTVRDFREWTAAEPGVELVSEAQRDEGSTRLFVFKLRKREKSAR